MPASRPRHQTSPEGPERRRTTLPQDVCNVTRTTLGSSRFAALTGARVRSHGRQQGLGAGHGESGGQRLVARCYSLEQALDGYQPMIAQAGSTTRAEPRAGAPPSC